MEREGSRLTQTTHAAGEFLLTSLPPSLQKRCRPTPSYIEAVQTEVNATMRGILVDWLVEVRSRERERGDIKTRSLCSKNGARKTTRLPHLICHPPRLPSHSLKVAAEFRLVSDTLYAAVAFVDRVLSVRRVERPRLQLVGVAATLVAAKYEEIYAPSPDEFVYITDGTYTRAEVLAAETDVLAALDFDLSAPTAKTFLRRFVKAAAADGGFPRSDAGVVGAGGEEGGAAATAASSSQPAPASRGGGGGGYDRRLAPLAAYVCELALLEYACLQWRPSTVAAAAVAVARWTLGAAPWGPALGRAARTGPAGVAAPAALLLAALAGSAPAPAASTSATPGAAAALPAVRDKYAQPQYLCVAGLAGPGLLPVDVEDWWAGGGGGGRAGSASPAAA